VIVRAEGLAAGDGMLSLQLLARPLRWALSVPPSAVLRRCAATDAFRIRLADTARRPIICARPPENSSRCLGDKAAASDASNPLATSVDASLHAGRTDRRSVVTAAASSSNSRIAPACGGNDDNDATKVARLTDALVAGSRVALSRAITLVESSSPRHYALAQRLLADALGKVNSSGDQNNGGDSGGSGSGGSGGSSSGGSRPHHKCIRLGIAGPPGAGKSTFIEALGLYLIRELGALLRVV
jgi:hypothetical protein